MKQENEEPLKRLDELCDLSPSKVILDVHDYETRHLSKILAEYNSFIKQFEVTYSLITDCALAINYIEKTKWPKHRGLQFLLCTHNLKTLYSSFDRLTKGFYEDSLSLCRTVYEACIKIIFLNCYPQSTSSIFQKIKGEPNFVLDNFLKDNLKLDWHDHHILSMMTHANNYSVLHEWVGLSQKQQIEPICLQFQFDKRLFEMGVNYICFLLLLYLKFLEDIFITETNKTLTPEMLKVVQEMSKLRTMAFENHPLDYWPKVMLDVKDVFTMIERIDKGEPWGSAWSDLRKNISV